MYRWWHDSVVYQIYPRSFKDSNGDGIGDIPGIISKLDYIKDLGVNVIWLSPVYKSPNDDNGYDISDYRDINPEYGTMKDMERLITEAGERGIKIVMDLVINHTSDEHPWFIKSRQGHPEYRDYYYWRKGKNGGPPNNWTGFFGGGTWEKDEHSDEWYLHLFSKKQPDLNYHNPKVLEEIKDIMRFWLDKGIAGFRCDVINILFKTTLDDGKNKLILKGSEHYLSQEGNHKILQTLRKEVLSNYDCFTVGETVFVTPEMARDLCGADRGELDMVFSFEHMETDQIIVKWFKRKFRPKRFFKVISKWQRELDWNANYLENHDQPRSVSRFGDDDRYWEKSAKMLAVLLLTLRGTPYIYQGQEIGMTNFDFVSMEEIRDVESHNIYKIAGDLHFPKWLKWKLIKKTSRDNARTPMQWDPSENGGFSEGRPWINANHNYTRINVANQKKDTNSILSFYKDLIQLRAASPVLRKGTFKPVKIGRKVFIYEREYLGKKIKVILNFSPRTRRVDLEGNVLISNYKRGVLDGKIYPWEGVIVG
ncbi:MAG: glycoside hydrolase family 13 protein [Eubacteriales bacterium]